MDPAENPENPNNFETPVGWTHWDAALARNWIAVPAVGDDKYARGVLGVMTGSQDYPGAAVLGVEAAMRAGVGMVRYLGPRRATRLVLERRPEVVSMAGRVQAWLVGSGMDASQRSDALTRALRDALAQGTPVVIDAGALDLIDAASGPVIVTPHARELARLFAVHSQHVTSDDITDDPAGWASRAAAEFNVTVLLKGHVTYIAQPNIAQPNTAREESAPSAGGTSSASRDWPRCLTVDSGPTWLATAGTGDILGGILGALVATHASEIEKDARALVPIAATAAYLQQVAATRASAGGPIAALDVAGALPVTIQLLLGG